MKTEGCQNQGKVQVELIEAVKGKDLGMIQFFLNQSEDVSREVLQEVLQTNDVDIVRCFLNFGVNAESSVSPGRTMFMHATDICSIGIMKLIAKYGLDINKKWCFDESALMIAIRNEDIEKVKFILDLGADVNFNGIGLYRNALAYAVKSGNVEILGLLLKFNFNSKIQNDSLLCAFEQDNFSIIKLLLDAGIKIDANDVGKTSLGNIFYKFIEEENIDGIKLLIESGADLNFVHYRGTPLMEACASGKEKMVRVLIELGADINITNGDYTALRHAQCRGHKDIMKFLIEKGADVNKMSSDIDKKAYLEDCLAAEDTYGPAFGLHRWCHGVTILMNEKDEEIVKLLIDSGADINARDWDGKNALMHAVIQDNLAKVKLLLDAGVDVNARDRDDETAIMSVRSVPVQKVLIEAGADITLWDKNGDTPLMHCSDIDLIQGFIDAGANINERTNRGNSLFLHLIKRYSRKKIEPIIKLGIDINISDLNGKTALMYAVKECDIRIVELLLDLGADVNAKDNDGNTALMYIRDIDRARLLIKYGADINCSNNSGITPLINAVCKNDIKMVELLIDSGADKNIKDVYGVNAYKYADYNRYNGMLKLLKE